MPSTASGKLDHEHATLARHVTEVDIAAVCDDGLASDREAQAEPGTVGFAPAGERLENNVGAVGDAAALVLHFDPHVIAVAHRAERDEAAGMGELEGVVQQVHHGGLEQLRVAIHGQAGSTGSTPNRRPRTSACRLATGGDLAQEGGHRQPLAPLDVGFHPHVRQRVIHEVAQVHQAAAENAAGAAVDRHGPRVSGC